MKKIKFIYFRGRKLLKTSTISLAKKAFPGTFIRWREIIVKLRNAIFPATAIPRQSSDLRLQGNLENAEQLIKSCIRRYPNSLGILIEYAEIAMAQKNWPEAQKRWEKVIKTYGAKVTPRVSHITLALNNMNNWESTRKCNICGCIFFGAIKQRKSELCLGCGSKLRTRLLYLYIQHLNIINNRSTIFHLAPERGLYEEISKIVPPSQYIIADLAPSKYAFVKNIQKFDLCHDVENLPNNHFDLIIHSHVMEHVPCNYSYILKHLHRSMKSDGWHICVIPFLNGYYDECFAPLSYEEATRRFGQSDHVRRIGTSDISNTFGRVISIDPKIDVSKVISPEALLKANIPEDSWKGLSINTVLTLRKNDYIL